MIGRATTGRSLARNRGDQATRVPPCRLAPHARDAGWGANEIRYPLAVREAGPAVAYGSAVNERGGKRRQGQTNAGVFALAERREPPGPRAIAAHTTENAICVESLRGGNIERRAGRAAYAAPLKKMRARTRFGIASQFEVPARPSPTARR